MYRLYKSTVEVDGLLIKLLARLSSLSRLVSRVPNLPEGRVCNQTRYSTLPVHDLFIYYSPFVLICYLLPTVIKAVIKTSCRFAFAFA